MNVAQTLAGRVGDDGSDSFDRYTEARADKEQALATIAQIKAALLIKQVVKIEDVIQDADEAGRDLKSALSALPDRVAPVLVGLNEVDIQRTLREELRDIMNALADRMEIA
jgi:phage terminase Nu1 subunit (DNA packaging protein)